MLDNLAESLGAIGVIMQKAIMMVDAYGSSWNAIVVTLDDWPMVPKGTSIVVPSTTIFMAVALVVIVAMSPKLLRLSKGAWRNHRDRQSLLDVCEEMADDRRRLQQRLSQAMQQSSTVETVATVEVVAEQRAMQPSKPRRIQPSKPAIVDSSRVPARNADNRPEATDASVARYSKERLLQRSGYETGATSLYQDYCAWCDGLGVIAVKQRRFGDRLKDLGFEKEGPPVRRNVFYQNVVMKTDATIELEVITGGKS